jgi:predicted P-loop ATPase
MAGVATLARKPLTDVDLARIRWLCERRLPGGVDKNGNQKPLVLDRNDILDAVVQVADTRKFHPVRTYLESLKWDGVRRLERLPELMSIEDTPLARTVLRCWFVSAVARVSNPGCQVDTMLVLVGPQGARKSSFFRVLAGPDYFLDTPIDIHSKDAYIVLRRAFIAEWPELESLNRARDAEAVKAFLTSAVDVYRPPFGRLDVRSPRSCVIVGTTNHKQFLVDETGGRRFWPLLVRINIDLDTITLWRDQPWAEAFEAYTAGERWYLDPVMEKALEEHQADFKVSDAWEGLILAWTDPRRVAFTIADVLKDGLGKHQGQWTRGDEMRVSRVLMTNGYVSKKLHRGGREWMRATATDTPVPAAAVDREPGCDDA